MGKCSNRGLFEMLYYGRGDQQRHEMLVTPSPRQCTQISSLPVDLHVPVTITTLQLKTCTYIDTGSIDAGSSTCASTACLILHCRCNSYEFQRHFHLRTPLRRKNTETRLLSLSHAQRSSTSQSVATGTVKIQMKIQNIQL